jgi:protocatechuate 3,4-dioxygenase alpha subunit
VSETDVGEIGLAHERPLGLTPSQTAGPYFAFALTPGTTYAYSALAGSDLATGDTVGEVIEIVGRVIDGEGAPITDAMVEIWQADGAGRYPSRDNRANTSFKGFGRAATDGQGGFSFQTVKPGAVPGPDGRTQAPHIDVGVFARGVVRRLFTRIYFEDEPTNNSDPILALVPADRRATLIARRRSGPNDSPRYELDIRIQGENETVFFEA